MTSVEIIDRLGRLPDIRIGRQVPLSGCGSFQLGGPAGLLVTCTGPEALKTVRNEAARLPRPLALMGAGTNILFSDAGWPGTLVRYTREDFCPPRRMENGCWRVNAAVQLDALAEWACQHGIGNWEAFSGIPGTVGGAVVGNAGAWGVQMEHMLQEIHGWDDKGETRIWSIEDCGFSYRDSRLKHDGSWVSEVILSPIPGQPEAQCRERARILALRTEKHPDWRKVPCIGSFFKNIQPSSAAERRQAAGWFLDKVGAKGEREGGAAVFAKHANILIKDGPDCTAADVLNLSLRLQARVREQFGIDLEREVQLLGF